MLEKEVKSAGKKTAVKKTTKPEVFVGKSSDLSLKKALKDALLQTGKRPAGYSKYEVIKIEVEKGIIPKINNLLITIKKTKP